LNTYQIPSKTFYKVGRVLLGIYFLIPGLFKFLLFENNLEIVILREVPFPIFSLLLIGTLQVIFGTLIIVGKKVSISACILVFVTVLINFYIHDFWNMVDGSGRAHETQNFVKNLGILAGLFLLIEEND
tara:strand:+ start:411 stop:797 length:387 start_codon:yes stop_codon:yes gene_type:complete